MTATDAFQVIIFDQDEDRSRRLSSLLVASGLKAGPCHRSAEAVELLRKTRPAVAVVVEAGGPPGQVAEAFPGLRLAAHDLMIPTLAVVDVGDGDDPAGLLRRVVAHNAWVAVGEVERELSVRVAGLLGRSIGGGGGHQPLSDSRFLSLIVHDLRTPLNVIVLTIRAIAHSVPNRTAEFDEDLLFLQENAMQTEKMLSLLADYCRLIEGNPPIHGAEFDPQRFLGDLLEERMARPGAKPTPIRLEVADTSPREVSLDPTRSRLALLQAIANAVVAAGDGPVRMRSSGHEGRWIIELIVDKPPPASVASVALRPHLFERLTGSPPERKGFDLAVVSLVSELMGGSARIEVEDGRRSTIVLDWPQRLVPA